jgi:hypothetical protein
LRSTMWPLKLDDHLLVPVGRAEEATALLAAP